MIRIFLPLFCAALGFAAASCGRSEGSLTPAQAPVSSGSALHGAASAAMASPFDPPPAPAAAKASGSATNQSSDAESPADTIAHASANSPIERRASTLIGMPVVSADGNPLGRVKDIIFDREGRATHLVLSYAAAPQAAPDGTAAESGAASNTDDRRLTAMPWDAAMASIKDGRLVLEGAKLQGAPSFTADAWPDLTDPSWSTTTDTYWRKAVRAAIAAHPGTPIDPTSRQRGRRDRDGS